MGFHRKWHIGVSSLHLCPLRRPSLPPFLSPSLLSFLPPYPLPLLGRSLGRARLRQGPGAPRRLLCLQLRDREGLQCPGDGHRHGESFGPKDQLRDWGAVRSHSLLWQFFSKPLAPAIVSLFHPFLWPPYCLLLLPSSLTVSWLAMKPSFPPFPSTPLSLPSGDRGTSTKSTLTPA